MNLTYLLIKSASVFKPGDVARPIAPLTPPGSMGGGSTGPRTPDQVQAEKQMQESQNDMAQAKSDMEKQKAQAQQVAEPISTPRPSLV